MSSTVMLVTANPISPASAQDFVGGKGADHRFLVIIPARVSEQGFSGMFSDDGVRVGETPVEASSAAGRQGQGGNPRDPIQENYGFAASVEAEALAGAVTSALETAHVAVDSRTVPHHALPKSIARLAEAEQVSEVVIATHAVNPSRLVGADLASRVKQAMKSLGLDIPVEPHHF